MWFPQSHTRDAPCPVPKFLIDELIPHAAGLDPGDLVFANGAGGVLDNSNFRRKIFDPAVRGSGLAHLTPHNLRDTAASLAVSAGAHVKVVQRMLGHASAAMTLDTYASLFADDLDDVAERLDVAHLEARKHSERQPAGGSVVHQVKQTAD
jgi:integrase